MQADLPGDAIVIRFRPNGLAAVLGSAQKEARRTGRHGLSVFAAAPRLGESEAAVTRRLVAASELAGIAADKNPKYYVCTRAAELLTRGFTFHKDEDDDEVAEHYTVDLGDGPTLDDVARFLEPFGTGQGR